MATWTTRVAGIAALRTQMQDASAPQRYTDTELGEALDEAISELSAARPIISAVYATLDSTRIVRLDNQIGAAVFGSVVSVLNVTDVDVPVLVGGWQYYEQTSQHKVFLPELSDGDDVEITVRCGYGFSISVTGPGVIDSNIPAAWRDALIQGAQGFALELYGAREVGRSNVSPAVAQQTARAASVKLRDFRTWLTTLPYAGAMREFVAWGLDTVDARTDDHRGFG